MASPVELDGSVASRSEGTGWAGIKLSEKAFVVIVV